MRQKRIEEYALIGDLHTAALVGRDGSIDWLCTPRFDSGACFSALLGDANDGVWRIAPVGADTCDSRDYRGDALILETNWKTDDGEIRVVDAMPPREGNVQVIRIVQGISGRVEVEVVLRLRFDYGQVMPWTHRTEDGLVISVAGPDETFLHSDAPMDIDDDGTIRARFAVDEGQHVSFVLTHHASYERQPQLRDAVSGVRDTERFWKDWIGNMRYQGKWRDEVKRSLVLLKALTYAPSGGILAAATTSIPESIGGGRNWDYRYCWLRDATFTLQALLGTGFHEEARAWREWLVRAVAGDPSKLQIMYGIDGRRRLSEFELEWLNGYEGSKPVRVGNAASEQFQLDVWGEVLDLLHLSRMSGLKTEETAWDIQRALLDFLEGHWSDPDNSLWEIRAKPRHFVHSKVMAWAGINRAVTAVERFHLDGPVERWKELQDEIHKDVCDKGFDSQRGTFTQYYGSAGLDAALLLIPRVGFLPWDDERVIGTVKAVGDELLEDGFMHRYGVDVAEHVDGLPGSEGTFLACSFWYADALHGIGKHHEAVEFFERLLALRNDVGILAEEYDPAAKRMLGNVPQAFSHVGLINTARLLSHERPAQQPTKDAPQQGET